MGEPSAIVGLDEASGLIRAGEPVAFPTETVYGLGAIASSESAVARVFEIKGRPSNNPLIVHVSGAEQARAVTSAWPELADRLARLFWPGPLTLVLPRAEGVPGVVTAGGETVAVRCPDHPLARALLERVGAPLVGPSANRSGEVSPTAAQHVVDSFGGSVRVIDGGSCERGIESTVLDLTADPPAILRPGALDRAELTQAIGYVAGGVLAGESTPGGVPRSPGQLDRHYAPRTAAELFEPGDWPDVIARTHERSGSPIALITHRGERFAPPPHHTFFLPPEPIGYARNLYAALRSADALSPRAILIERVPTAPGWAAIADRLSRAARPAS